MEPHHLRWLEPAGGVVLMLLAMLDLFLTVLYARAGAGFISNRVARVTWASFRRLSGLFGRHKDVVLSLSGSTIVVSLVAVWAGILTLGSALIMHPYLGTSIRSNDGSTNTDFLTALYAGGSSMSLVGSSDYSAKSTAFRLVFLVNSAVGMSVMSLALTYIMQVYNALQRRNTFGLTLEQMSGGTGDAAVLIKGVGPDDEFSAGYTHLGNMADAMSGLREAHDFYPVLFYFRFPEVRYSASRMTVLALDAVSLIRSALPEGDNAWIKRSASVSQLWQASTSLLKTLEETFIPGEEAAGAPEPSPEEHVRWAKRYSNALATLREAGIKTVAAEDEGANTYIGLRKCWNRDVVKIASYLAWRMDQIDPATPK